MVSHGIQIGDPLVDRAILWSRADKAGRMIVDWSLHEDFRRPIRIRGPHALPSTDYCTRLDLLDLPAGRDIFVRVMFESLDFAKVVSEAVAGHFRTAPGRQQNIRFVWGGDTAGQGWGIDLEWGGMRVYEAMRQAKPDFFLHSGDTIYADGPMAPEVTLADGSIWHNAYLDIEPAKLAVAQTLEDYRGCYRYNLLDKNVRRFNSEVAQVWQWDDHEVVNNWSDGKDLASDARYLEKRVQTLAARAGQAFREYAPLRGHTADESERVYRYLSYGPDLDVFVLDMRSYRGKNTYNRQDKPDTDTVFLGEEQLAWLKHGLRTSRATWKVLAADMPIGVVVGDGRDPLNRPQFEAIANGDGPVLGREFEIANLLRFIKRHAINNTVWLTADVHYCAAHYYDPEQAVFRDFAPFWEFVAGPLHAGSFGPNALDNTFGPQVIFQKAPPAGQSNLSPKAGLQFFGQVDIDGHSREMIVSFKNAASEVVFSQRLAPLRCR